MNFHGIFPVALMSTANVLVYFKRCIELGPQFNLLVQLGALYMCQKYYSSSELQLCNDPDSDRWITLVDSPARADVPCQLAIY